jgi:hypothetical protein
MTPRRERTIDRPHFLPHRCFWCWWGGMMASLHHRYNSNPHLCHSRNLRSLRCDLPNKSQHFEFSSPARARSSRGCVLLRGVASCPNQSGPRAADQENLRNICSLTLNSAAASSFWPTASSRRSGYRIASSASAANAPSDMRTFSSKVSASRAHAWHSLSIQRSSANSSSGGGLGIQQPGSHTSGGFFTATARSGRARERAICPAAARFTLLAPGILAAHG